MDFGAGLALALQRFKYFPSTSSNPSTFNGALFQGSNDNTTWTTILALDTTTHDAWNSW